MSALAPISTRSIDAQAPRPGWRWTLLTSVARLESGHTPSRRHPEYWGGDIPWLSLKDIQDLGSKYVFDTLDKPTMLGIDNSSARVLPPGTVAFCRTASVGKVAILGREMATSQDFVDWVCGPSIDPEYLYWALRSSSATFDLEKQGSTHKTIYMPVLKRLSVLLPPLEMQHRITSILDRADAIRRKRQEAVNLTEQLLRATFLEMFGNSEVEEGEFTTVADLAADGDAIRTGPFGSQLLRREFVDSGIAVLGIDNTTGNEFSWGRRRFVTEEKYKTLRRYTVHPGDVLITIMGTCGRCAIVPDNIPTAINTKHLCCITLDRQRCLPEYLHAYFLHHPTARRYLMRSAKGAIMDGLNMTIIKNLPVPVVSLDRQQRYRAIATRIRNTAQQFAVHAREADDLFHALTHQAFTGQL